ISGHIIDTIEIIKLIYKDNNYTLWFQVKNMNLLKYIFYKGFICIDGISLTVGDVIKNQFCVHLIPETLSRTTIKNKKIGDLVNLEID
ncbi:MAG: riboflavin synthase, partial [Buchnera aphidicola]|nr:riboflavin synthase [Buchnera aphidicola]